jgi:cell wall-associated NlpC family hydrolase
VSFAVSAARSGYFAGPGRRERFPTSGKRLTPPAAARINLTGGPALTVADPTVRLGTDPRLAGVLVAAVPEVGRPVNRVRVRLAGSHTGQVAVVARADAARTGAGANSTRRATKPYSLPGRSRPSSFDCPLWST